MKVRSIKTTVTLIIITLFGADVYGLPESPVIDRQVHITENRQYLLPTIPTLQTSADGRIGLSHKRESNRIVFRLQVPEKIEQPFIESPSGTFILANPDARAEIQAGVVASNVGGHFTSHSGLCDPSSAPDATEINPKVCGVDDADDCYDLTIIRTDAARRIWGTPVRVRVSNPKTPNAQIEQVALGTPVSGHDFDFLSFFEPMVTSDGRLLSARVGAGGSFNWSDNEGVVRVSSSDIVYFVNDNPDDPREDPNDLNAERYGPCDVRQWDQIRPLGHAPYDNTINQRYGFAMQPFRDTTNNIIADGQPIGTYPWIDKDGDNISFTSIGTNLFQTSHASRCPLALTSCVSDEEAHLGGLLEGRVMMGLWTQGKMVLLDDLINNIDFGLQGFDQAHREVQLYEASVDHSGWTRVGNGRDNNHNNLPLSSSGNTTFFDSNEHRFNYLPNMRPVSAVDVTWLISSGRATTEVPFDDYLNVNSFINANMAQIIFLESNGARSSRSDQVQNSATATRWDIPSHGDILGQGRIEPVAKGGIHGKGFWLDGSGSGLRFSIGAQPRAVRDSTWYYGVFVDTRDQIGERVLMTFPDDSEIRINGENNIVFISPSGVRVHEFTSAVTIPLRGWGHLGFQLSNQNRTVTSYVNGYRLDEFTHTESMFELQEGDLVIGASTNGNASHYTGWVDDFKVFAESVNVEVACNHARGTLAGVTGPAPSVWRDLADSAPNASHDIITQQLSNNDKQAYSQYVCYHNYSDDFAAHLRNIPTGLEGIRDAINFPEGPLFQNRPRPESRTNAFCLSCHIADGNDGLDLDALALRSEINAPLDDRRQPMQPDFKVYGNIPANWLGQGIPANPMVGGDNGILIDELILPIAVAVPTPSPAPTPVASPSPTPRFSPSPESISSPNGGSSGGGSSDFSLFFTLLALCSALRLLKCAAFRFKNTR